MKLQPLIDYVSTLRREFTAAQVQAGFPEDSAMTVWMMLGKLRAGGLIVLDGETFMRTGRDYVAPPRKPKEPRAPKPEPTEDEQPQEPNEPEYWMREDGTLTITDADGDQVSLTPNQSFALLDFMQGMVSNDGYRSHLERAAEQSRSLQHIEPAAQLGADK